MEKQFLDKLKDLLIKHEGFRTKPYKDTVGKLTIGIGRNLDDVGLSEYEVMVLFANDVQRCIDELRDIFKDFDELPENVKLALIDMIFNLGKPRFLQFKKMIQAIKDKDFEKASEEAKDSRWCKQVKTRCEDIVNLLKKY